MKNFIIAFCVFLVWSFFGLWLFYWLQEDTASLQSKQTQAAITELTMNAPDTTNDAIHQVPLDENTQEDFLAKKTDPLIEDSLRAYTLDGDILFNYDTTFTITKNNALVNIPTTVQDFKYKLNNYFVEHPNTELHVTSQYSAEENTTSPNMGVQRAEIVKEILVNTGIPSTHIVIKPHITPIEFDAQNRYTKAFSFEFQPLSQARVDAIKNDIPETKIVYPRFSTSGILKSPELENLLEDVKLALDNNPNISVTVIGHTDNVGNANDNYARGLTFARQVRWYLVAKGNISRHRIKATSKGESQAVATNKTKKGRVLNQRIEVHFTE